MKENKVTKETYDKVAQACNYRCALCGSTNWLEAHHIYYRSERKDLINEPTNLLILCKQHHLKVHTNKHKYQPMLLEVANKIYKGVK